MKKSKTFHDLVIGGIILVINIIAYYAFPVLFFAAGRLVAADVNLTLAEIMLLPVCLYKKLWVSSVILVIVVAAHIQLLMLV
jgi:hypothetical protein